MGFNKRFLKKENILHNLNNLITYLSADAIICTDDFSHQVYKMYSEGKTKEEIINVIDKIK
jgi:metallophosphoesterase superfamily enzyme